MQNKKKKVKFSEEKKVKKGKNDKSNYFANFLNRTRTKNEREGICLWIKVIKKMEKVYFSLLPSFKYPYRFYRVRSEFLAFHFMKFLSSYFGILIIQTVLNLIKESLKKISN